MITGIMNFYHIILGLKLMSNLIHTPLDWNLSYQEFLFYNNIV
jgi:hypothetical protein